jgi:hypothetical protein
MTLRADLAAARRSLSSRLDEMQVAVDLLQADSLDDRILLHEQIDPQELREWQDLVSAEHMVRALGETGPEEQDEMRELLMRSEILREGLLVMRLEALHTFAQRENGCDDEEV